MSNSRVLKEKPKDSVLVKETYSPALATDYTVQGGDSWVGLARKIGLVDPWDLIDFNFPGIKEVRAKDAQLASPTGQLVPRRIRRLRKIDRLLQFGVFLASDSGPRSSQGR